MSGGEHIVEPSTPEIDDRDLSAYLDGELAGARRQRVADAIAQSPFLGRRLETLARADKATTNYADALMAAALPARLCVRRMAAERWAKTRRRGALAAAAVAIALVAAMSGWVGHGVFHRQTFATRMFIEEAAAAHHVYAVEVRHPVEVAAAEQAHLVAWLSKRLSRPVAAPSLAAEGFHLVGGRLLPGRSGAPAAQLMYENAEGLRLTIYAARNATGNEKAFRYFQTGFSDAETVYWLEPHVAYALTGSFGRERLLALAQAVLKGLEGA